MPVSKNTPATPEDPKKPKQVPLDHKANTKISSEIIDISPALAEKYLGQNIGNRNLRTQKVKQYARDMRNGSWHTSGQAIQFDWNGRLIDGQHRCEAIIESGVTIRVLVVKGLDPQTREVIDTGAKRSGSDALKFAGFDRYPNLVAALARIADARENGFLKTSMATSIPTLTNSEVISWAEANTDAVNAVALAHSTYKKLQITPSIWAYCLYELEKVDGPLAIEFAHSTADMRGFVGRDDPRKVMLDIFQRAASGQRRKPGTAETIYIVFRAWNAWVAGATLRQIVPGKTNTNGNDIPKLRSA